MGVLKFTSGSSSQMKWTSLASALQNVPTGAWTVVMLLKRGATQAADAAAYDGINYLLAGTGAGTVQAGFSFKGAATTDTVALDGLGTSPSSPSQFTSKASPYLLALSKTAGTTSPRLSWKLGSGGAWTHEALSGTAGNGAAAAQMQLGTWQDSDFGTTWMGVAAWYSGAMSDTDKAALDTNWQTSDLWNSAHGQPLFLAEMNVAAASVVDLASNASSLTPTGMTLDAGETLDGWNFDGIAAGPPPAIMTQYTSAMRAMKPAGNYF